MAMLPSGLPEIITDDEDLARFLTQSSQFTALMVKPAVFLPRPEDRETSVFRHGGEPKERLWTIGLAAAGKRKFYGAAIVKAKVVRANQLEIHAVEPPPRHAVVRGWPWDGADPDLQKAKRKEIATVIASQSVLLLR
jgi:hypothetical protein